MLYGWRQPVVHSTTYPKYCMVCHGQSPDYMQSDADHQITCSPMQITRLHAVRCRSPDTYMQSDADHQITCSPMQITRLHAVRCRSPDYMPSDVGHQITCSPMQVTRLHAVLCRSPAQQYPITCSASNAVSRYQILCCEDIATHLVSLSASESACSGIPYTCSTPGKTISIPTELGPAAKNKNSTGKFTSWKQTKAAGTAMDTCMHVFVVQSTVQVHVQVIQSTPS